MTGFDYVSSVLVAFAVFAFALGVHSAWVYYRRGCCKRPTQQQVEQVCRNLNRMYDEMPHTDICVTFSDYDDAFYRRSAALAVRPMFIISFDELASRPISTATRAL